MILLPIKRGLSKTAGMCAFGLENNNARCVIVGLSKTGPLLLMSAFVSLQKKKKKTIAVSSPPIVSRQWEHIEKWCKDAAYLLNGYI